MSGQQQQFVSSNDGTQSEMQLAAGADSGNVMRSRANTAAQGEYQVTFMSGAKLNSSGKLRPTSDIEKHIKNLDVGNLVFELHPTTEKSVDVVVVFTGPPNNDQKAYLEQIGKTAIPSTPALREDQRRRAETSVYLHGIPETPDNSGQQPSYTYVD